MVNAEGDPSSKIALIGEAPGAYEERFNRPFVGPSGRVLDDALHAAGLLRSSCYITNVVKIRPSGNDIGPYFANGSFTAAGSQWRDQLLGELEETKANVLVALGTTAFYALAQKPRSISSIRGYLVESVLGKKLIGTFHPSYIIRGNSKDKLILSGDLRKAFAESAFPELKRPERDLSLHPSLLDLKDFIRLAKETKRIAFDIEVVGKAMSIMGLALRWEGRTRAITLDMSSPEEASFPEKMRLLKELLEDASIEKITQNGLFDFSFLHRFYGIITKNITGDTMILHSLAYAEFPKNLNFLGSLYLQNQENWKFMVKDQWKDEA